jgi:hypothetical protein
MTLPLAEAARAASRALADLVDSIDAMPRAAAAQVPAPAQRAPAPHPPPPPSGARVDPEDVSLAQIGRHRGEPLSSLADADLVWYGRVLQNNVDDDAKARTRERDLLRLAAAIAERDRRSESRPTPDATPEAAEERTAP